MAEIPLPVTKTAKIDKMFIDVYSAKMAEIPLPVTKTAKIDKMFIEKRAFLSFVSENNTNKKTFKIFLQS